VIINGVHHDRESEALATLLVSLGMPQRGVAVAVNGEVIPRSAWDNWIVTSSDTVEIVTAAAGGA
jgi:sulfur carrier protein